MSEEPKAQATESRRVLLVDDDPDFSSLLKAFLMARQTGSWIVYTAEEYSSALTCLKKNKVDLVILDLTLPVMDGSQFQKMLKQSHPELPVVILTGQATPEQRAICLQNGAALFLDKTTVADGFESIYPALEAIAFTPAGGFRGMLRQVEIPDILQLECLGRKSSVLEIKAGSGSGRIFIKDGTIIHAENGSVLGEPALFQLLGLAGGEFQLKPFQDPGRVTIEGNWESLLMESARLRDEAAGAAADLAAAPATGTQTAPGVEDKPAEAERTFEEIVLCSGAAGSTTSEVLYEWQTDEVDRRVRLLDLLAKRSELFSRLLPLGQSDRLEIEGKTSRTIALLQTERKVLVRIGIKSEEPDEITFPFLTMDDDLQSWIRQAELIPGVLACGARRVNQSIARSCHKNYPEAQVEKLMRELAETVRLIQTNRIPGERMRWTFEHAWIYSTVRHDGAVATLVVDRQTDASPEIERLLSDFQKNRVLTQPKARENSQNAF